MGTKYMLLGIALLLAGILFCLSAQPAVYIIAAGGLVLAVVGLLKDG